MTSSNGNIFRVTGPWRGALMVSLICVWINGWINNREAGDLRRHRGHYDVNVMCCRSVPSYCVNQWRRPGAWVKLIKIQTLSRECIWECRPFHSGINLLKIYSPVLFSVIYCSCARIDLLVLLPHSFFVSRVKFVYATAVLLSSHVMLLRHSNIVFHTRGSINFVDLEFQPVSISTVLYNLFSYLLRPCTHDLGW